MEELLTRLNTVPNSYFGFVAGISNYAKQSPERLQTVLSFLRNHSNLSTSDIIEFVSQQPDFFEDEPRNEQLIIQ
ncbi:MAG: hypothetical protein E7280_11230 [Lachnospiraceae bacterium]|nr:hypothetical protein [Lachnospiraceae bacterium]